MNTARTSSGSAGSGIPARGLSRNDRARRKVDFALSYGPLHRAADFFHGLVDARRTEAPLRALPWVRRLELTYGENALRIQAGTRDVVNNDLRTILSGRAELRSLESRLVEAEAALANVQVSVGHAGPGELHLPAEALSGRAERDAAARRAPLAQTVEELRARRDQLRAEVTAAESVVAEEFGMAQLIVIRMHDYYQRRLHTYARRFLRSREDVSTLQHQLPLPDWATGPCPWLDIPAQSSSAGSVLHLVG